MVASAISPDYALGTHTASLGLAFNDKNLLPRQYASGALLVADDVGNIIWRVVPVVPVVSVTTPTPTPTNKH